MGRPVEIDDAALAEFADEMAAYIAVAVKPPVCGPEPLRDALLASPGFARFKAAIHAFYEGGGDEGRVRTRVGSFLCMGLARTQAVTVVTSLKRKLCYFKPLTSRFREYSQWQ